MEEPVHFTGLVGAPERGVDGPITASTGKRNVITLAAYRQGTGATMLLGEKCLTATNFMDARCDDDYGWASGWDSDINRWGHLDHTDHGPITAYGDGNGNGEAGYKMTNCITTPSARRTWESQLRHVRRFRATDQLQHIRLYHVYSRSCPIPRCTAISSPIIPCTSTENTARLAPGNY